MSFALLLHLLAVIVWVGGMFFAHVALRPAAAATLDPPQRQPLFAATLGHFFRWVTVAIVVLLATGGYLIVALGGMRAAGAHVHAMLGLGVLMMLIFGHIRFVSYRRLQAAVAARNWPGAGTAMGNIRKYVLVNLVLGALTVTVAVLGRGL
jgi:uncharacterized membrane protein